MDQKFKSLCEALCLLAEPPGKGNDLSKAFEKNILNVCDKLDVKDLNQLPTLINLGIQVGDGSDIRWKWVLLALHIFLLMKENHIEKECMLSVQQEKAVRTCLEFVISMALLPSLIPGVGIPITKRCSSVTADWLLYGDLDSQSNQISIIELHERLSAVTKALIICNEAVFLRGPMLSRHLCDLLAALCQLSMAPLKKPQKDVTGGDIKDHLNGAHSSSDNKLEQVKNGSVCSRLFVKERQEIKVPVLVTEVDKERKSDDFFAKKNEEFQMTPELWNHLQVERQYFSKVLEKLVHDTYQPLVIRDLLLLQGSPDQSTEKGKPAPMWLRRGCANLLNSCIFRKGGVIATVRAICDVFSVPESQRDTWAQHAILGKLVVMAVSAKKGDFSCCQSICSQVVELLSAENIKDSKDYARAGLTCISMLLDAEEEICKRCILDPLFPFVCINSKMQEDDIDGKSSGTSKVNIPDSCKQETTEENEETSECKKDVASGQGKPCNSIPVFDLNSSLDVIHFCFVENDPGMSLPAKLLAPLFPKLLGEYSESNRQSVIKPLLLKFLSSCSDELVLSRTLDTVLFEGPCNLKELKTAAEQTRLENQGEAQNPEESEEKLLKDLLERHLNTEDFSKPVEEIGGCDELGWGSAPLLEIVSSDGGGEAAEVLFRYVLQALPKGGENSDEQKESGDWLVSIAKQSVATKLLCHLLEVPTVSEQVRKNPKDIVSFLGNFLAKEAEKAFGKHDDSDDAPNKYGSQSDDSLLNVSGESSSFPSLLDFGLGQSESKTHEEGESEVSPEQNHSEFVLVALLILKSLCETESYKSQQDWWCPLRNILPQIRAFRRESSCPEVRAMAEDVACAILTKGKVGPKCGAEVGENKHGANISKRMSTKYHPKGKTQENISSEDGESINLRNTGCEERLCEFEMAFKMAQENAVHLRGHALISLSKLISSKDPVTLRNKTTLLQMFQDNLKHDDSYVYLAAINGLEQLGNIFPDQVLESLADEFAEIGVVKAGNAGFNDVRLKVGEALLRVTRTLGEMAPKYSCLLLNAFLGGVRDGDGLVRASSLSNLGEICKILSFRLGSITTEVLWCVRCVLETDSAVEARRAAVLVITLLLQGMGVTVFKVLESNLPEMYRTLKSVRCNDPDDVVKIHAQIALEEVNRITMQFLFPQQTLQKKIFVLDPPS